MTTIYMRKEPTNDSQTLRQPAPLSLAQRDVVAYRDKEATQPIGRWPWFYQSKPDRRFKRWVLNCFKYQIVWIDDLAIS